MTIRARSALALFCLSLQSMQTTRLLCQTQPAQSDQKSAPTTPAPRPNPNADGIYHVAGGVTAPKLIYSVEPEFSEQARKRKMAGSCTIRFVVETDGHVRDVHIVKSASDGMTNKKDREAALSLDQKAIEAVNHYRYEPGLFKGKPVPIELEVDIGFQIF